MRIVQMREYLFSLYPKSERWRDRVKKMTDNQVVAVMMRIQLSGQKPRN